MHTFCSESLKESDNSKDLGVDGSIILDLILLIQVCGYALNSCGSGQKKANQYITEI
jgi:hypothetical protein